MDKKCAPGIKYEQGSCIKNKDLKQLANAFNLENPTKKIEVDVEKKELVENLKEGFKEKYKCDSQICWLNQSSKKAVMIVNFEGTNCKVVRVSNLNS